MINDSVEVIEIYPRIFVYRNFFADPQKNYEILKESTTNNEDRFFTEWTQWSRFGDYLNPAAPHLTSSLDLRELEEIDAKTPLQQIQKDFLKELITGFYEVSEDYVKRMSDELKFDINEQTEVRDEKGQKLLRWRPHGVSICRYHKDTKLIDPNIDQHKRAMMYHSDYIREPLVSPGYKFTITVLAYINDDYENGEIDFAVNGKLFKYKPKAGDFLVFPSGHPEVLTSDGDVYLHSVVEPKNEHKYFARMYWQRYSEGDQEWFDKENEFGKDTWLSMQDEIMENFRKDYPQRLEIENGVRIS